MLVGVFALGLRKKFLHTRRSRPRICTAGERRLEATVVVNTQSLLGLGLGSGGVRVGGKTVVAAFGSV